MSKALEIAEKITELNGYGTAPYILCKIAALELERLDTLNAELVAALSAAMAIIGHPEDSTTIYFQSLLAKAKEQS